eukprot:CAMPEP_0202700958 /NCGR_PEP_ID=MMETSP1385-20130828/14069_1 /ASSEMBLY_ACC=CAM_ASM_000861 /TAXON_ID=933848 /ORGANISM="Elphidium margaritaceum" /LENGTH=610 /DNA_ID=CAMNT_0049358253 /DNA_START=129 /DNA_END=1961 /DNA_ORIENTATION=-
MQASVSKLLRRSKVISPQHARLFSLPAHGTANGQLVDRLFSKGTPEYAQLMDQSHSAFEINLNKRQTCDIELILNGGFSPLQGFMTSTEYNAVVNDMQLPNGTIWPMPICLDISEEKALEIEKSGAKQIILRDGEYNPIALMDIEDLWKPNKALEADAVFGGDAEHPAIQYLNNSTANMYIGGTLHGFQLPPHYDYTSLRRTPQQVRELIAQKGWKKIVAFQTRNPMHRAHIELTKLALDSAPDMNLLIHPVVGMTKPGDIDHHTRVKCIHAVLPTYPQERTALSVLPLAMRMGGPREAIWHCLIRKNYGVTHFILGRDHAGPGSNSKGEDFYGPYDARDAAVAAADKTGINCLSYEMMVYSPDCDLYYPTNAVPEGKKTLKLSGTEVRRRLKTGEEIPDWFSYPAVVDILREAHPPNYKKGLTIFFTGLSGSGKSTIANALCEKLMELQNRRVSILDGDYIRKMISSELGFSEEHRNLNIKRIGFISSLVAYSGGLAIAAPIAPYKVSRDFVREVCSEAGGYLECYVKASLDVCEQRDRKGLYAKARKGIIKGMTGIDDPYEEPQNAELVLDTGSFSVGECCDQIIEYLMKEGYIIKDEEAEEKQAKAL